MERHDKRFIATCWIIAGPNGAGKTTFALEYLPLFVSFLSSYELKIKSEDRWALRPCTPRSGGRGEAPHPDDNPMFHQFPLQRNHATGHALAIHLHPGDAALTAVRILNLDRVDRFTVPIAKAEALP